MGIYPVELNFNILQQLKDGFQSVLRTLESLFAFFVLPHARRNYKLKANSKFAAVKINETVGKRMCRFATHPVGTYNVYKHFASILVQYSDKFMHSIVLYSIVLRRSSLYCIVNLLLCGYKTIQCYA